MSERPANDEMIAGFLDGYDSNSPEPASNRSHSYRHGFMIGRLDKTPSEWGKYTADQLRKMADAAMDEDDRKMLQ
jgi:hypothetical protein